MRLYHFTSEMHMPSIMAYGVLRTTGANLDEHDYYKGPRVLWTTTDPEPSGKHGLNTQCSMTDKEAVRFTVDIPDAEVFAWEPWADAHGIDPQWKSTLAKLSGGPDVTDTWRLCGSEVPCSMWVKVENLRTGADYRLEDAGHGEPLPAFYSVSYLASCCESLEQLLREGGVNAISTDEIVDLLVSHPVHTGLMDADDAARARGLLVRDRVADTIMDRLILSGLSSARMDEERVVVSPKVADGRQLVLLMPRSGSANERGVASLKTLTAAASLLGGGFRKRDKPTKRPAKTHGKRKRGHR